MEKVDFNNWDTCDKLYSRDSKKTVRAFQSKAQFILPVDLGECNTQTDPKKEEAEGTMSEGVSALCIWGKEWLMVLCGRMCRAEKDWGEASWEGPHVCTLQFCAHAAVLQAVSSLFLTQGSSFPISLCGSPPFWNE